MRIIRLLLLLMLVFAINATDATAEQKESAASKAAQPFQVKLPDGLYLFQPKLHESRFSPLFIIKGGKLIDPYPLAKNMGIPKFMKKYVTGKTFNVYVGTEMIGKLSDVKLQPFNDCLSEEMFPDIPVSGKYEGKPLPGIYSDKSIYPDNKAAISFYKGEVKAIATPQSFKALKKMEAFSVTEEDKAEATKAVRGNLIGEAMKSMEEWAKREKRQIVGEKESSLVFAKAIDLDGNSRKDIIGLYELLISHRLESTEYTGGQFSEILFILWDTGKIERIPFNYGFGGLGGVIDLDQDGVSEIILQIELSVFFETDGAEDGRQIEIWQHTLSGWKRIYHTIEVCRVISYH